MPAVCVCVCVCVCVFRECVCMCVCVCVWEASSHLFDRWDCAILSVVFILWISLCLHALFWFVFISVWHVHIWLSVCMCSPPPPPPSAFVCVCIGLWAHALSKCRCIPMRFIAAVICGVCVSCCRCDPGTTSLLFALCSPVNMDFKTDAIQLEQMAFFPFETPLLTG